MTETGIGLSRRASLLYQRLLLEVRGRTDALATTLGWEPAEVEEAVEDLRAEGLVTESGDENGAIRAVEPCIALPPLLLRRMRKGAGIQMQSAAVERFIALHERAPERQRQTGVTENRDEIVSLIERMIAKVDREVVFLVPNYGTGTVPFSRPIANMVLRRGASLRAVWAASVLQESLASAHAHWLADQETGPRTVPAVPLRAVLMDGVVAVVVNDERHAQVVRSAEEVGRLYALADRLWEGGRGFRPSSRQARAPGASRSRSEVVLRLLAEGLTDEAIARRLGCSVRTVRSDVAAAMTALDARSRFQAGVRAMQVGLV